jgi:hypothetical protein
MNRRLRTVRQPFAPLPRAMLEGGLEPPTGIPAPGDLSAVRLPLRHTSGTLPGRLRGKESNLHDLLQRQASSL